MGSEIMNTQSLCARQESVDRVLARPGRLYVYLGFYKLLASASLLQVELSYESARRSGRVGIERALNGDCELCVLFAVWGVPVK